MKVTTSVDLSTDARKKKTKYLDTELSSYDKNSHEFELRFKGTELEDTNKVNILSIFDKTGKSYIAPASVRDGKAYFEFDTDMIEDSEMVTSFVHIETDDMKAEVDSFKFHVDVSEIELMSSPETNTPILSDVVNALMGEIQDVKDVLDIMLGVDKIV